MSIVADELVGELLPPIINWAEPHDAIRAATLPYAGKITTGSRTPATPPTDACWP